ncbi:hypothetical protein [Brazilian marseillevirus]|uniref:hypothetical protein n=1 Tax=Brazilian marseillevirus TaxID=1813599 RepID=UPI0007837FDB|nr:hypothetical protein A3303_gp198 [Brazilian marseillevirus]AMQ10706.1 hypothetical protein [Brazilian marseillevirus]
MKNLSNEVVLHILSFCGPKELCLFGETSQGFLPLTEDESLWKNLCQEKGYPEKTGNSSWRRWYAKLSRCHRVDCQWYYGSTQKAVLLISEDATQSQVKLALSQAFKYREPERIVINGCSLEDQEQTIPRNILERGLLVSWVK